MNDKARTRNKGPSPFQHKVLILMLQGLPDSEIAQMLDVDYQKINYCRNRGWVAEQLDLISEQFLKSILAQAHNPMEAFQAKIMEKVGLLDELTKSEDKKIALAAIREWINHAIGMPVARTHLKVDTDLANLSLEELRFVTQHLRLPTEAERLALRGPREVIALPSPQQSEVIELADDASVVDESSDDPKSLPH